MKLEFSENVFEKYSNIKFHENPPRRSRVVAWGQTNGGTDMMKLPVASRNCVNAPKNFLHELSPKVGGACSTHSHTMRGRFTILHSLKIRRPATPLRRKMGQN